MTVLLLLQVVAEVAFLAQQPKNLSEYCASLHTALLLQPCLEPILFHKSIKSPLRLSRYKINTLGSGNEREKPLVSLLSYF